VAIEADTEGKSSFIGFVGLRGICPRSRRAEIWIYIGDKAFWGKGLGQEATTALCRHAFEEMNLHRVWLELDPENVGAKKCYEKAGFVLEGTLRQAYYRRGKYRDTCMMGLLRPDFEAKERKKA
jgi:RimJ/RimL family protein N-acetyltransferase